MGDSNGPTGAEIEAAKASLLELGVSSETADAQGENIAWFRTRTEYSAQRKNEIRAALDAVNAELNA